MGYCFGVCFYRHPAHWTSHCFGKLYWAPMKFVWRQKLGRPECPYIERWVFDFYLFSIRVHHWLSSDDPRHFHDHPWFYYSYVISGAYKDCSPDGTVHRKAGTLAYFPATHKHTVQLTTKDCWTILFTGREKRDWGFWVNGKFHKRNRYFFDYKHYPCR